MILLLVYVDDILITRESQADIQEVIKDLHAKFTLKIAKFSLKTLVQLTISWDLR